MEASNGDADRVKGPWSPEEDQLLVRLVQIHGPRNWSLISRFVPGRTGKSCRLRWFNQLSPTVRHRAFTPEEDAIIVHAHNLYGNKWAAIARLLEGRTDNSVKNHWHSTLKRRLAMNGTVNQPQRLAMHEEVNEGGNEVMNEVAMMEGEQSNEGMAFAEDQAPPLPMPIPMWMPQFGQKSNQQGSGSPSTSDGSNGSNVRLFGASLNNLGQNAPNLFAAPAPKLNVDLNEVPTLQLLGESNIESLELGCTESAIVGGKESSPTLPVLENSFAAEVFCAMQKMIRHEVRKVMAENKKNGNARLSP